MSHIDTINYSHVGSFLHIPVYHPLQEIKEEAGGDFSATPKNLVIGGGSGEHPGLVIKSLDFCVLEYLDFMGDSQGREEIVQLAHTWTDSLTLEQMEYFNVFHNLEFNNWSMENITEFTTELNKEYEKVFKNNDRKSAEEKLNIMLGEFIFWHAQSLISTELVEYLNHNKEKLDKVVKECFKTLKIVDKDSDNLYGRYTEVDSSGSVRAVWGLAFKDEDTVKEKINKASSKIRM